jgi:hypothetical protein
MKAASAAALAALAALIASAPRVARADSCRGSGGSSSSSSGGSGESSSGESCDEVSDVVGQQRCSRFGESWSQRARMPAMAIEAGLFTRQLEAGFSVGGTMVHETESFAYQVATVRDRATAAGAALRVSLALPAPLYVGADLELGGLLSDGGADVDMGGVAAAGPIMAAHRTLYMGAGGVAGVRGQLGRAGLAAEVVAGVRDVALSVESQHGDCLASETHHRTAAFAEPRVRIDVWLTPWVTVAGFAGSDLDGDSKVVGASLAFHLRAFDHGR